MNSARTALRNFLITICIGAISACGGGGGKHGSANPANNLGNTAGDGQTQSGSGNDQGQNGTTEVNQAGNTGYLYYVDSGRIVRHNVATGDKRNYIDTYYKHAKSASASDDGTMFAVFELAYHDLDVYNTESKRLLHLTMGEFSDVDMDPPASFSPDNKYIMFRLYHSWDSDGIDQLQIYDLNGNMTGSIDRSISAWDWLDNNEIIVAMGDTIYRWPVSKGVPTGTPTPIISLGGDSIWDLSVSPDKTQIAFIQRGATAHVVDIVGGADKHIASIITDSPTDKWISDLISVRWAPNGKSILVGARGINMAWGIRNCTYMSIFPTNADTVLDTGDSTYWLVHKESDAYYYTCENDLYSLEWTQN